jgi:predicted nucleic acid-binding protein
MTTPLACVIDASVAVKLFLAEPLASQATDLFAVLTADFGSVFHVPDLFYAECANIFWTQCQWGGRSLTQAQADLVDLRSLRLQVTSTLDLVDDALVIAGTASITAYDACYVALAQRHGLALITADQRLVNKLSGGPHSLIWLGSWTPPVAGP